MTTGFRSLATGIVLIAVPQTDMRSAAQTLQLPPFSSIDVRNGGHVVMRSASTQRVILRAGSLDRSRVRVTDGNVLVIDRCYFHCPRGYELEVEIQSPAITRVSLANGGRIQSLGGFAPQADLVAEVRHGGTIDVRSLAAERVDASVEQGGRILTVPRGSMTASVVQGGVVTYWGNAQVKSSIEHGGIVDKGTAEELTMPLSDIGPPVQVVPPVPVLGVKSVKHGSGRH